MESLKMDPSFAQRNVNEGFSGGEKKRHEIMQLELLKPKFAILDETDSGLDVDALRIVSEGVVRAKAANNHGILLTTREFLSTSSQISYMYLPMERSSKKAVQSLQISSKPMVMRSTSAPNNDLKRS
jgi:Fe-S cluster assembly ATPase SufC